MIVEVNYGVVQVNPHYISGIAQTPENGFDKYWADWHDINAMLADVKTQMGMYVL